MGPTTAPFAAPPPATTPAPPTPVPITAGWKQCPVCGSWETVRHAEAFRVWFTCNRCQAVFK